MDDPGVGGKRSRAPEIQDVIKICRAFNAQGVRYVLIGGIAVILHGFTRGTGDIDFIVDSSCENVQKIKIALAVLPDNAVGMIDSHEVQKYSVVRIADEVVVDLMERACGINYEEASQDILYYEIDDVQIPVASKALLIKLKDTVRPSDRMDRDFLEAALAREERKS